MLKINLLELYLLIIILAGIETSVCSQTSPEQKKVEVIVNLNRFIDWSQNDSYRPTEKLLYIITDDKSCLNFQNISKKSQIFKNWKIICSDKIIDFKDGSVIFITKSKEKYTSEIIKISFKKDVLTISENSDSFCTNGGMINIIENADQIKFEINYRIIQNKSIDISSKLLALSKIYN
jgi:hypothetical protein